MKWIIFAAFFVSQAVFGGNASESNDFYKKIYLGEYIESDYSGPLNPLSRFNTSMAKFESLDALFSQHYLEGALEKVPFELHQYWFNYLLPEATCSNEELGGNLNYIRYLYRLVSISYLFEEMKAFYRVSMELNLKNKCSLQYADLFNSCHPQTKDMMLFKERVQGKFVNEYNKQRYGSLSKRELESWLSLFKLSTKENPDIVFTYLNQWALENHMKRADLSLDDVKKMLDDKCIGAKKIMNELCSENDDYYSHSYSSIPFSAILNSNAFSVLNKKGRGEACLIRYEILNKGKAIENRYLKSTFPIVKKYLEKEKYRFQNGDLFLAGALKEFDEKGLGNFLVSLRTPIQKTAEVPIYRAIKAPVKKELDKPHVLESVLVEKNLPSPSIPVPIEKLSEFESKVKAFVFGGGARLMIDMDIFREDFEFSSKAISELSSMIKKFQTQEALKQMRDFDRFGKKEAPVGLIFLKFLIDTQNHQGLYNVINVIGDKFFVFNDFEGKKNSVYVELKNDETTHHQWTFFIIDPPKE